MRFNLRSPCDGCPFRTDVRPFLTGERAREIAECITKGDVTFACHKTLDKRVIERSHCAGALVFNHLHGHPNRMIRIAQAFGLFRPKGLDVAAPVFRTVDEMEAHHGRSN